MGQSGLSGFAARLEAMGELRRVGVEVDPSLEVAEVVRRLTAAAGDGPALLFERPAGCSFPLAVNLFGSERRLALALGQPDLASLTGAGEALCRRPDCLLPYAPRLQEESSGWQVTAEPDLGPIPFTRNWQGDGSKTVDGYLTLPLVVSRDPLTGRQNCGIYRVSRHGASRLGLAWRPESGAGRHYAAWCRRREPMPLAVVLGGPPALIYAATVPFPADIDEMAFAGMLTGEPLSVVRTEAGGLQVPAAADLVLEGYVHPDDLADEGRFGNHTGRYVSAGAVPVMTVTRITRSPSPLIPATVTGSPPTENRWFAKATERLMLPFLRKIERSITDCAFIPGGEYHGAVAVAGGDGEGGGILRIAEGLRRTSWLAGSRLLLFINAGEDCRDAGSVFWRTLNRPGWPAVMEQLPPLQPGGGGCLVIDATRPHSEREDEIGRSQAVADLVSRRWSDYGIDGQDDP